MSFSDDLGENVFMISALNGDGCEDLVNFLISLTNPYVFITTRCLNGNIS